MPHTIYTLRDFDYDLPDELIAQAPAPQRDGARLLVIDRKTGSMTHSSFAHIADFFHPGDCLVINNTKVIPARLIGKKRTGAAIELLLLKQTGERRWEALLKPAKRVPVGGEIVLDGAELTARVCEIRGEGRRLVEFSRDVYPFLDKIGIMPLPPYIKRPQAGVPSAQDRERYQTVYAARPGAVAAPTAGLHFTDTLLKKIAARGVETAQVTLHVGYGTFKPVETDDIVSHKIHAEEFDIPEECAQTVNETKRSGAAVFVVGTTTARALESAAGERGIVQPQKGETEIFIYPPYRFKIADRLITNFHLPQSTLLMMVAAFAGRDLIMRAYEEAIREKYRFYSYGDAMLIL